MGLSVGTGIGVDVAVGIGSGVGARVGIGSLVGIGADVGMDVGAMVAAGSDVGSVSPQATISRTQKSAENSGSDRRFLANIGKIESTLTCKTYPRFTLSVRAAIVPFKAKLSAGQQSYMQISHADKAP